MVLAFPILADYSILYLDGHMVFATHGHQYNLEHPPLIGRQDVLLHGHTHVAAAEDTGELIYLNPGSLALPKNGAEPTYMIYENGTFTVKTLCGEPVYAYSFPKP